MSKVVDLSELIIGRQYDIKPLDPIPASNWFQYVILTPELYKLILKGELDVRLIELSEEVLLMAGYRWQNGEFRKEGGSIKIVPNNRGEYYWKKTGSIIRYLHTIQTLSSIIMDTNYYVEIAQIGLVDGVWLMEDEWQDLGIRLKTLKLLPSRFGKVKLRRRLVMD